MERNNNMSIQAVGASTGVYNTPKMKKVNFEQERRKMEEEKDDPDSVCL